MTTRIVLVLALVAALPAAAAAQPASAPAPRLGLSAYVARVLKANPDLRAARAALAIARAQVPIAKVFPDPQLSVGLTQLELTHAGQPDILGAQVNVPIELGGKRGRRIRVAEAGVTAAGHDYEGALRDLRAAAANAFIDALYTRRVVAQKEQALANVARLVTVNERRYAAGDIGHAAVLQSRVEARQFAADVLQARGERDAADVALWRLLAGAAPPPARFELEGDLAATPPSLKKAELLAAAESRPDVRAAAARAEQARRQIDLERAKRVVDVTLGAGWLHYFPVGGPAAVKGADLAVLSVGVPLPFSKIYRGELDAARAGHDQAERQLEAARVRARAELEQALARFDAAAKRVAAYETGILADSLTVLDRTLYTYQRGGATLVEVLIAQRTASDVHLAYLDALAARARALVALGQAAGMAEELLRL
jgi:cobalt-zinc-cadmium efflux system outer membrane protein